MKQKLKHHAPHLALCAPMVVVAVVLLASGTSIAVLIPVVGCMLMMAFMMAAMGGVGQRP
ncbi:MAG: hypothetical protein JW895_09310 [Thermoleophilaceae bacterium]|nr:hypothetical protein [Thermoleophilaceae bacterium]